MEVPNKTWPPLVIITIKGNYILDFQMLSLFRENAYQKRCGP